LFCFILLWTEHFPEAPCQDMERKWMNTKLMTMKYNVVKVQHITKWMILAAGNSGRTLQTPQ